jgi:hypothetical protein
MPEQSCQPAHRQPSDALPPPRRPLPLLQSYLTGLGGNTLLLSYFAGKREVNAVVVQALGIASSFAVLTQIRVAGFMPRATYALIAVFVGLQVRGAPGPVICLLVADHCSRFASSSWPVCCWERYALHTTIELVQCSLFTSLSLRCPPPHRPS